MSTNDSFYNNNWELILIALVGLFGTILWFVPQVFTYPWAAWRITDSYIWSSMPLPNFITQPHENIVTALLNLDSWRQLDYRHIYQVEYSVMHITTWLYLTATIPSLKRIITKTRHHDTYKKRLTFDELIEQETHIWRHNRYLVNNDPTKDSRFVEQGKFACREPILSGLKRSECIYVNRKTDRVIIDHKRIFQVFSAQLKNPYQSPSDLYELPFLFRFLIVTFSLREITLEDVYTPKEQAQAWKRYKRARRLLKLITKLHRNATPERLRDEMFQFSYGNYDETLKFKHKLGFNESLRFQLLGDYSFHLNGEYDIERLKSMIDHLMPIVLKNSKINEYISQHSYAETLLRRLLREGRGLGKFGPSQFSFVKMLDRDLWFALNDEGIPGSSFEAVGVKAHFEHEFKKNRRHVFPTVESCITYLEPMNIPTNGDDFDSIIVNMEHPFAKKFPYDPSVEYKEHCNKMKSDKEYLIEQTTLRKEAFSTRKR